MKLGTTAGKRRAFRCLLSDVPVTYDHIRVHGKREGLGARLMAIVAKGDRGRIYLAPTQQHEATARDVPPTWKPDLPLPDNPRDFKTPNYGLPLFGDLFTLRQLVALTIFSDLVGEAMERVRRDAVSAGLAGDDVTLGYGGMGAAAYSEAVAAYCSLAISKLADYNSSLVVWSPARDQAKSTFARQALPMVWDFAEVNPLAGAAGDPRISTARIARALTFLSFTPPGQAVQGDARELSMKAAPLVSTDPPYYDNIGYADLSDFFYLWLRRSLKSVFPELFATLAVPKAEELVATPYRHGSKEAAESFFLDGMKQAMRRLAEQSHPGFPVTIYYAFKQSEKKGDTGTASTGWETFLDAVIQAGFGISGTWPMRTERGARPTSIGTNALASSILLVCHRRTQDAPLASRREFLQALKAELPEALARMQGSNIAPVDLAQAAIGPGMAIYTRYSRVLESDGSPLSVRTALEMINQILDEVLAEQEGDFDADTRWALAWFEQSGFAAGDYGVAETLSKAKNTSVAGMVDAGILQSGGGKVRLFRPEQLPADYSPSTDTRLTVWEMVHHLIRTLESSGEGAAADLVAELGAAAETARELAYRLYSICERKKRAPEALSYNSLVQSWPEIRRLAHEVGVSAQADLFEVS